MRAAGIQMCRDVNINALQMELGVKDVSLGIHSISALAQV